MPLSLRHESSHNIRSAEGLSDAPKGTYEVAAAVLYLKRRAIREAGRPWQKRGTMAAAASMTLFGVSSGKHFRDQPHGQRLRQQTLAPLEPGIWSHFAQRKQVMVNASPGC